MRSTPTVSNTEANVAELESRPLAPAGGEPSLPASPPPSAADQPGQRPAPAAASATAPAATAGVQGGLGPFVRYFLKLGTIGFGGPAALVGFMHRDLVVQRQWIDESEYKLAPGLAQIMPGPLAAQLAIALG